MLTLPLSSQLEAGAAPALPRTIHRLREHTVEIVSDSGEGAQKCGQVFGAVSAKMGNGVWTVEIIPAEIQPPARVPEGASGFRIRLGDGPITNWGDATNLVVAFNEQVLLARHRVGALADDAVLLVEDRWATHDDAEIRAAWQRGMDELSGCHYRIIPVPMEELCLTIVDDAKKGKNMFALGLLACVYARDLERVKEQIAQTFRKKSEAVYARNVALMELGWAWADEHLDFRIDVPVQRIDRPRHVPAVRIERGMEDRGYVARPQEFGAARGRIAAPGTPPRAATVRVGHRSDASAAFRGQCSRPGTAYRVYPRTRRCR